VPRRPFCPAQRRFFVSRGLVLGEFLDGARFELDRSTNAS